MIYTTSGDIDYMLTHILFRIMKKGPIMNLFGKIVSFLRSLIYIALTDGDGH